LQSSDTSPGLRAGGPAQCPRESVARSSAGPLNLRAPIALVLRSDDRSYCLPAIESQTGLFVERSVILRTDKVGSIFFWKLCQPVWYNYVHLRGNALLFDKLIAARRVNLRRAAGSFAQPAGVVGCPGRAAPRVDLNSLIARVKGLSGDGASGEVERVSARRFAERGETPRRRWDVFGITSPSLTGLNGEKSPSTDGFCGENSPLPTVRDGGAAPMTNVPCGSTRLKQQRERVSILSCPPARAIARGASSLAAENVKTRPSQSYGAPSTACHIRSSC
jgi:hypothetical protein